jgi:hypothetical protein
MNANEREWGTEELFFKGYRGAEEEEVFHSLIFYEFK